MHDYVLVPLPLLKHNLSVYSAFSLRKKVYWTFCYHKISFATKFWTWKQNFATTQTNEFLCLNYMMVITMLLFNLYYNNERWTMKHLQRSA